MCITDIILKNFSSSKYIEMSIVLKIYSLQFCKSTKGNKYVIFQSSITLLFIYVLFWNFACICKTTCSSFFVLWHILKYASFWSYNFFVKKLAAILDFLVAILNFFLGKYPNFVNTPWGTCIPNLLLLSPNGLSDPFLAPAT